MDIGCQYQNYCSDITRTFPASGKFSPSQKNIYQAVLNCQKKAIQKAVAGYNWERLEMETRLDIYQELLSLKIIKTQQSIDKQIEVSKLFMPHSLGHTVGLKVHDSNPREGLKILKANMVVAIEPGIYFIESLLEHKMINKSKVSKYLNVGGVRIEDTILITSTSPVVLSNAPKEISDIEKIIKTNANNKKTKKKSILKNNQIFHIG